MKRLTVNECSNIAWKINTVGGISENKKPDFSGPCVSIDSCENNMGKTQLKRPMLIKMMEISTK